MKTLTLSTQDPQALPEALKVLLNGGLVAFPTDTVYGLGALITLPASIERLFFAKERETSKAIAVLIGTPEQLELVAAQTNEEVRRLARRFWPGALTLVVARHPDLPEILSQRSTVGVRMPDHPDALALLSRSGPLATTSANLSGGANPQNAADVLAQLDGRVELVLDGGPVPGGLPSTVVDCTRDKLVILRQGPITLAQLLDSR